MVEASLSAKACLIEIRADWDWFQHWMGAPACSKQVVCVGCIGLPLFDLPGVSNQLMFPDWMHVMDEGFGALVAGQILHYLLPFYPGNSAAKRVEKLWEHILTRQKPAEGWTHLQGHGEAQEMKAAQRRYLCHCCQSSLKQNLAMWGQWQSNSKQCMPWPNSWPECMTA